LYLCPRKQEIETIMEDLVLTIPLQDAAFVETLALRMGWTMRRRTHSARQAVAKKRTPVAKANDADTTGEFTPRVMRFKRGNPWYATDEEVDRLRYEYLTEKYK